MTEEKKKHGFANLTPERQKEIASHGGKASHELKRGHEWTSETAKLAAAKSVESRKNKKQVWIDK